MPRERKYEDFDLRLTTRDDVYCAKVVNSPGGETDWVPLDLPFKLADTAELLLRLENAILRSSGQVRGSSATQEKMLRDFGREMFQAVFVNASDIRDRYTASISLTQARPEECCGLRLKLRIDSPELASMPWEFMWDERSRQYVTLQRASPLIRYLEFGRTPQTLSVKGPLRVLGMIANPGGEWDELDTENERRRIDDALAGLEREGRIAFRWVPGESPQHLLDMMPKGPWHVFHFIGHGGVRDDPDVEPLERGFIVLTDETGGATEITSVDLSMLLEGDLRLAVLNCCEGARGSTTDALSSPAAALVRSGVPAVIAMQFSISDNSAKNMASGFYRALADNFPVDEAVTHARKAMRLSSKVEWAIPVLFMRSTDGRLFETPRPEPPAPSQEIPADQPSHDAPATGPPEVTELLERFRRFGPIHDLSTQALDELLELGSQILERKPEETHVRQAVAEASLRRGTQSDTGEAEQRIRDLTRSMDLGTVRPEALFQRANALGTARRFTEALSDIDEAIRLAPSRAEFHWTKGMLQTLSAKRSGRRGDLRAAIEALTTAIDKGPPAAKYYKSRCLAHAQIGDDDKALADIDSAIALEPDDGELYFDRGRTKLRLGDNAGAKQDLETAKAKGYAPAERELARIEFANRFAGPAGPNR